MVFFFIVLFQKIFSSYINEEQKESGEQNFDYTTLNDSEAERSRESILEEKSFFYFLPGELFENVHKKAASDPSLNEILETVFKNIEASAQGTYSEGTMKGLFDDMT